MSAVLIALMSIAVYVLAYSFYARYIQKHILDLNPNRKTPAYYKRDGVDYVPAPRMVLFGHHFASIAGLGPIVGPAIAAIWGWLPALLWLVFGTIFLGAVHDFVAAGLSLRFGGRSIGDYAGDIMGRRVRILFLLVVFFVVGLFMGAFAIIVGKLLDVVPKSVIPVIGLIVIAVGLGIALYRFKVKLWIVTIVGVTLMAISIWLGILYPIDGIPQIVWIPILLVYSLIASVIPVWLLLQPRDYLNSFQLYFGLGALFVGLVIMSPQMQAPAVNHLLGDGGAIPSALPLMFMVVACGAISGFHSLVSSGTTVRQVNNEKDIRFISYGGMLTESFFGLIVLLACTAGVSFAVWQKGYADFAMVAANPLRVFLDGGGTFLSYLGIAPSTGRVLLTVMAVGFAMTTLDSATRLLRYNVEEIAGSLGLNYLRKNRYLAAVIAVVWIGMFVLITIAGHTKEGVIEASENPLWPIAGMSNQLLAALGLLTASVYFYKIKKPTLFTLIPMLIMMIVTMWAIIKTIISQLSPPQGVATNYGVLIVSMALFALAVWLIAEGLVKTRQLRNNRKSISEGLTDE